MGGSLDALDFATSGWFFSNALLGGVLHVKIPSLPTDSPFSVELSMATKYPEIFLLPCNGGKEQSFMFDPVSGYIKLNSGGAPCVTIGKDKNLDSGAPAL